MYASGLLACLTVMYFLFRSARSARRRLYSFIDNNFDAILVLDIAGVITRVNPAFVKMLGYSKQEVEGKSAIHCEFLPEEELRNLLSLHEMVMRGEALSAIECVRKTKSGKTLNVMLSVTPFYNDRNHVDSWIIVVADRTAQKQDQERLIANQEELDIFIQNNSDGIAFFDESGCLLKMNKSVEAIFGYSFEELQGAPYYNIPIVTEEMKIKLIEQFMRASVVRNFEMEGVTRDGRKLPILVSVTPLTKTITTYGVVIKDISQLRSAQSSLNRSEALSMIGQLAAGVAHEIRNPLTSLKGFTKLIELKANIESKHYFEIMNDEFNRIELILNEMLGVAKPHNDRIIKTEVSAIIEYAIALLQTQAVMKSIEIVTEIVDNPVIECDDNQIKQVFINVVKNAIEAMDHGGQITVRAVQSNGDGIQVEVIDQGEGMTPAQLAKLTEPFYSTKEKGTGLGLMMCLNIMEHHKGFLKFESELGKGTRVILGLPLRQ
ncbi:PAS domain S-box protein [Paenibacillus sp. NPDC058174]|uniref:PAS domain S-box protein n=1 Tax=Paenibacillus sp. NPDC058174 TaxID=3346366 RepID=UPI0036DCC884